MAQMDDFLKPESMMTPGVAGGITMTIANTLWMQFGLQQRWSGLFLSFAFGALVFVATHIPMWKRALYYVVNSLIIFSVAAGGNYVGYQTFGTTQSASLLEHTLNWPALTQTAYAAEPTARGDLKKNQPDQSDKLKQTEDLREIDRLKLEKQRIEEELEQMRREKENSKQELQKRQEERQRPFFAPGF